MTPHDASDASRARGAAAGLPRAAPEELDASEASVERALAPIGLHRAVERAYYYRLDEAAGAFELSHEWHVPHLRPLGGFQRLARLPLAILPDTFLAELRRGGAVTVPRALGAPGAPVEYLLAVEHDRALVLVPVAEGGALAGVAGFAGACDAPWSAADWLTLLGGGAYLELMLSKR